MKLVRQIAALAIVLGCLPAGAQVVFDENFDGGFAYALGSYHGGSPTGTSITSLSSGGNPNGCVQIQMTSTTSGDSYTGQVQLDTVTAFSDPNPANYSISFDAYGSQAANVQFIIQAWPNDYFGGTQTIQATDNNMLTTANTWQTFSVNLGALTTASPENATWQLEFQINASQWGGAGKTDTLKIDNIILTHLPSALQISSSANPSTSAVIFTGTVLSNGSTATAATGQIVFSSSSGPFSTNTVTSGVASSSAISTLPLGSDTILASYTGNFPATSNTYTQIVNNSSGSDATQTNLAIYTDNAVNGFNSGYSWASINVANTSPVHSGTYSIAVTDGGNQGLAFQGYDLNTTPYTNLSFYINGGSSGGQQLQVYGLLDGIGQVTYPLAALQANTWQLITIPLTSLGVANQPNFNGIVIQGTKGSSQPVFYVDDISLTAAGLPAAVHLGVNAETILETVDARQFGLNTATWDGELGATSTLPLLEELGTSCLRWPGGSTSDAYNWATDLGNNATFQNIAKTLGSQVFTTVNYGSGTASEAVGFVLFANKTNNCNFKYWEVGNECYGSWENDTHTIQHDPYTYATNAVAYIQQMKAAYPTVPIKVGVVVVPGEDSYVNNMNHSALNPVTGVTHYGWTPVVLSQMKALGVMPDFLIYHNYPQYTPSGWVPFTMSPSSDPYLLQVADDPDPAGLADWNSAATNLRAQITDYLGSASGSNIELCVTENNSESSNPGRQTTSVVNALYMADSTCALMKTEFRSCVWWDLHNGSVTAGDTDPTVYGWRNFGDYGIASSANNPYPNFYSEKMLSAFARAGDLVLNGTSDNLMLSAYVTHRADGKLTMLVVNKSLTSELTGDIALTNFSVSPSATVLSWGVLQDEAAELGETGSALDIQTNSYTIPGTSFSYNFPALSMTLFTFEPGQPSLTAKGESAGQAQLLLQGDPNTPYVIEGSSDLKHWTSISTNSLTGTSGTISVSATNSVQEYYQAVWKP
jgi:hypothetical protein